MGRKNKNKKVRGAKKEPQAHLIAEVLVRPLAPLPALALAQTAIDYDGLARGHVVPEKRLRGEI